MKLKIGHLFVFFPLILVGIDYFFFYPGNLCDETIYLSYINPIESYGSTLCKTYSDYFNYAWGHYQTLLHIFIKLYVIIDIFVILLMYSVHFIRKQYFQKTKN